MFSNKLIKGLTIIALSASFSLSTIQSAFARPGTLSDVPLFLSSIVEPNVFLTMDDSGSMDWGPMQSYVWAAPQHINVLELIACLKYLRGVIQRYDFRSLRFIHVVDSMVTAAVLAKGRSSSKVLNRTLGRIAALQLAGDLYVVPVWTVSGWNFSDNGSRFIRPQARPHAASTHS